MKVNQNIRKKVAETEGEKPEVPEDFICIDPAEKPLVFDFLTGLKQELAEVALIHLRLCLHCREIATTFLKINNYLEPNSGHCLHAEKSEVEVEPERLSLHEKKFEVEVEHESVS